MPELIQLLKSSRFLDQPDDLKQIISSLQQANKFDIQRLLETVNNDLDVDLQVKIFSVLTAYFLTNGLFREIIVTFHPLYDRINEILAKCSPLKTTITLNFICSILYNGEEDQSVSRNRSLVIHSQNMLRVSGCLATMSSIFANCMMYQDTWKALCRALSECCNGSLPNQTHCSGLIGICVQKCQQGHVEAYTLLQSLLQKNPKNLKLFLDCNESVGCFSREFLQYNACMQVLSILVQSSEEAVVQINNSNIPANLKDLLKLYGPSSQIGQWATVILFYLDPQSKKVSGDKEKTIISVDEDVANDQIIQNSIMKERNPPTCKLNETDTLLQNIAREVNILGSQGTLNSLQWNAMKRIPPEANRKKLNTLTSKPEPIKSHNFKNKLNTLTIQPSLKSLNLQNNNQCRLEDTKEMSFSFIDNVIAKKTCDYQPLTKKDSMTQPLTRRYSTTSVDVRYKAKDSTLTFSTIQKISISPQKTESLSENFCLSQIRYTRDFKPKFVSTPRKKVKRYRNSRKLKKITSHESHDISDSLIRKSKHSSLASMKQVKNRSMSSRFFDVINESCTSLVKTVTSIFRSKKQHNDSLRASSSQSGSDKSCSYSFTNYMKRRDAIVAKEQRKHLKESLNDTKDACKTCNDTIILNYKLDNDEQLRKTVKKIKLGINLYGCDFKKIARTMWPREKYMTPAALYQLYRKLIVNQR